MRGIWPRRPDVESERARQVLDWIDVAAYVFWVFFLAAVAVLAVVKGVPSDVTSLLEQLHR